MNLVQITTRFLVPLGVVLAAIHSLGQTPPRGRMDVYSTALIEASKEMEKRWGHMRLSESQLSTDYKHLLVYANESVPADYPKVVGERRFEYLTSAELLTRRKKAKKDFSILIVYPARVEGPRIKVVVAQDWVSVVKGHFTLGVSDWGAVFFRFDCEKGEFVFDEVQLGGI